MLAQFAECARIGDNDQRLKVTPSRPRFQKIRRPPRELCLLELVIIRFAKGATPRAMLRRRKGPAGGIGLVLAVRRIVLLACRDRFELWMVGVTDIREQQHLPAVCHEHVEVVFEEHVEYPSPSSAMRQAALRRIKEVPPCRIT